MEGSRHKYEAAGSIVGHATHVATSGGRAPCRIWWSARGARRGLKLVPERHVRSDSVLASVRAQPSNQTLARTVVSVYTKI
ncbi:unnamed protein product [Parnassius apollo]|uniref:(apollo) hypothetical protein n=1 Tax=Parnassius apollo TaxID=110799 RepID=A0A8S3WSU6_PARAO|nr:unnamed protein product [Parnassius apollo]